MRVNTCTCTNTRLTCLRFIIQKDISHKQLIKKFKDVKDATNNERSAALSKPWEDCKETYTSFQLPEVLASQFSVDTSIDKRSRYLVVLEQWWDGNLEKVARIVCCSRASPVTWSPPPRPLPRPSPRAFVLPHRKCHTEGNPLRLQIFGGLWRCWLCNRQAPLTSCQAWLRWRKPAKHSN